MDINNILLWQTWLAYLPIAMISLLVFFLNMRHTHRVLAAVKKKELAVVEGELLEASNAIQRCLQEQQSVRTISAEFNALVVYEARLRAVPTWPYNTSMLRTLFFSILIPLFVRLVSAALFGR